MVKIGIRTKHARYFVALPTAALMALLGTGCAGNSSPVSDPKPLFGFSDLSHPALASAIGTWQSACTSGDLGHAMVQSLAVADSTVTHTIRDFDDAACTSPDVEIVSVYTVSDADQYSLRSGGADVDVAMTLVSTTMTPRSGYSEMLNEVDLCGNSTWADDQPLRVEGLNCSGYVTRPAGTGFHDYLEVTGTSLTFLKVVFNKTN